jgi:O-methyltransferase
MDWHTTTLMKDIERHMTLIGQGCVILATTPAARRRYGEALGNFCASERRARLIDIEACSDQLCHDAAVVVVIADGIADSRRAYAQAAALKTAGKPVVFGVPERRLCIQPPSWKDSGIQHEGMFWLVSQYARTIHPRIGAFCEFGVYDGRSFSIAYHALKDTLGPFFAFDSFQGLGGTLDTEKSHFDDGQYFANAETFNYNMRYSGVDRSRVTVVPGFFQDTLAQKTAADLGIQSISVVHIDVDVYLPALLALEFVAPQLSQGAILLFDEFDQFAASNHSGERRALREWLARHPEIEVEPYRSYGAFARSFIVHRK